ncbi:hypothetical protein P7K49_040302 [Saguinus oedipus]|uniref:Uncharacterized protein n=1 Tax=Saguinus oedipus TaxID=9490 RepID=A0ABQ9TAL1_SAGOE|nr:hypothetical protein P7K49_040302 [Saguinus oedipus]
MSRCTAEQSFTAILSYAGILLERPLNNRTGEKIEGYVASLNKRTGEKIEGYVVSVQSFTAISKSFTGVSLYAGILLERPHKKCTAEQSFTAISLNAGILLERPLL